MTWIERKQKEKARTAVKPSAKVINLDRDATGKVKVKYTISAESRMIAEFRRESERAFAL